MQTQQMTMGPVLQRVGRREKKTVTQNTGVKPSFKGFVNFITWVPKPPTHRHAVEERHPLEIIKKRNRVPQSLSCRHTDAGRYLLRCRHNNNDNAPRSATG